MADQNAGAAPRQLPLKNIDPEQLVDALLRSAVMTPYSNLTPLATGGQSANAASETLSALPLEKRYVWRVASALKWAFADFEAAHVAADCQTMSLPDQERLVETLELRPVQFCLFLSALIGVEQMEGLMAEAIRTAREMADAPERS